jgi:hypothetical protein
MSIKATALATLAGTIEKASKAERKAFAALLRGEGHRATELAWRATQARLCALVSSAVRS